MRVWLNDEEKTLKEALTLEQALSNWDCSGKGFAVAVNQEFVPRQNYANVRLKADDKIDLVSPMQGG